jgi:hypothetical protein
MKKRTKKVVTFKMDEELYVQLLSLCGDVKVAPFLEDLVVSYIRIMSTAKEKIVPPPEKIPIKELVVEKPVVVFDGKPKMRSLEDERLLDRYRMKR